MPKGITSLEGFVRKLAKLKAEHKGAQLFFRGHSKDNYVVAPSLFRQKNWRSSEHLMIRQMLAEQPHEFADDNGIFDYLVRAQHYGLPTRLLDVSYNPMVALYFATCSNPSSTGQIVVLKPEISKQKYFDSDVVSCLSALSLLKFQEKEDIKEYLKKLYRKKRKDKQSFDLENDELEEFNDLFAVAKLINIVRQEKPDFRPILQPMDLTRPVSVVPRKLHARISAQNGAFVLFGLAEKTNKANMGHIELSSFNIEKDSKAKILNELSVMGMSQSALFPEIENSASNIKQRYS